MEKNDTKKVKDLKPNPKRAGNSVTGKPLDKIDTNPQLDMKEQNEEDVVLTYIIELRQLMREELEAEGLLDEALNVQQRIKRAAIMRRYEAKIQRAKQIAQKRLAPAKNIKKRAYAIARERVRVRLIGKRGAEYQTLGPSEKMMIDRQLDKKANLIKRLALRLIPRVKAAEQKRMQSFTRGLALKNLGQKETDKPSAGQVPSMGTLANSYDWLADIANAGNDKLIPLIREMVDSSLDPKIRALKTNFSVERLAEQLLSEPKKITINESAMIALEKKAHKADLPLTTILEVFTRGYNTQDNERDSQQIGFARVNSFINKGRTYFTEDADLQPNAQPISEMRKIDGRWQKVIIEGTIESLPETKTQMDEIFEKAGLWANIHAKRERGEKMRKPGSKGAPTKSALKDAQEEIEKPTKEREKIVNVPRKNTGEPTRQQEIKKKIVNENFNMAWTSGIGVTLTANDLGMKMQGGFEYHPSVLEDEYEEVTYEDVKSSLKSPVYEPPKRRADGTYGPAKTVMRKTGKKIIKSENPHDGE
jgi:hypothetical protein